jgi:peptide-methionine (S)-S-oxide reductase
LTLASTPQEGESAPGEQQLPKATLAGGCFWCMEEAFEAVDGVVTVTSGYTGGRQPNPTYKEVSAGGTGHYEAIELQYDPAKVSYAQLLEIFWQNIDPTDRRGQFCDKGTQYRAAIFYQDDIQKQLAEQSKQAVNKRKGFPQAIVTMILPASAFYSAEDYHQDFYQKNPFQYKFYKFNCGRAQRLKQLWGSSKS